MTKIKTLFAGATMDKDTDKAFIEQGNYRHAQNLRFQTNNGGDGVAKNIKGTLLISDVTDDNIDYKCVGALFNEDKDVIYYFLATSNKMKSKIVEYSLRTNITTTIISDNTGKLKLDKNGYITGINEINGLLLFAEWANNPRRINIERAKLYGINNFEEEDITVIVKPPLQKLNITLENTNTESDQENYIEDKMLSFSYRYRYLDGEYSVLAPFTNFAFMPKNFNYDFSEQSNRTMINKFNQVSIDFNTGGKNVTEIQLVFKETESNTEWIIDDFVKSELGYGNNTIENFKFNNSKVYRALPDDVVRSLFDNVPKTAKAQVMIDGRLLYGNYLENYDLIDSLGNPVVPNHKLSLVALPNTKEVIRTTTNDVGVVVTETVIVPTKIPKKTVKSNRDYQVDIVYSDGEGRTTTVLASKTDTIYIPNANSVTENYINIELNHKPPYWAKYYRFYIKQSKKGYDQVLPTIFYEDGRFRWFKLEGADKDKIKEGDYLTVKSDTQGIVSDLIKVKVLEVGVKEKNFLQPLDETTEIKEKSGLYFKIKPEGFRIELDDYESFSLSTFDTNKSINDTPIRGLSNYIDYPSWYGDTLNDLSVNQGSNYTGATNQSNRYFIKIDNAGAVDTFKWSDNDGATFVASGVPITAGVPIPLNNGVEITFTNSTGHSTNDQWNINARAIFDANMSYRTWVMFNTTSQKGELLINRNDEIIESGARITIYYDEYKSGNQYFNIDTISSEKYDNIQEWFIKENILQLITAQTDLVGSDIKFIRGVLENDGNGTAIRQNNTQGTMNMVIGSKKQFGKVYASAKTDITQTVNDNILVFETQPKDQDANIYYEVGRTYKIENNFHTKKTFDWETKLPEFATDQSQTDTLPLKVKLDWFNAFSYGNAVESYKIRDEFNQKGLATGIRVSSSLKDKYKEVHREADVTWSDVYDDETSFNGLGSFNLSTINFIKLDKEMGSIQKLHNSSGNLMVLQEDQIGLMQYNKNIIYDTEGKATIGVSNNILDSKAYRPYADGIYGISKEPESFVANGSRVYFTDKYRGNIIRLSINGITPLDQYRMEYFSSQQMIENKDGFLIGGYDPKHGEYLLHYGTTKETIAFKEKGNLFPNFFSYEPDFILGANNQTFAWKNGKMYRLDTTNQMNNFFGVQYESNIKFYFNQEFTIEKVWNSIGLESSHAWDVNVKTNLTERAIPKESFNKKEDFWYSEIMGNTNGNTSANSVFGIGNYPIVNGEIYILHKPSVINVGDFVISSTLPFAPNKIVQVLPNKIVLENPITEIASFLMYQKNQNVDGSPIRGDILEVDMKINTNELVELRGVNTDVSKSSYS